MENIIEKRSFVCVKCGNTTYALDKITTTGNIWTKIFNLQSKKFITASCLKCGYTELYKAATSEIENIADFFIGQ